MLSYHSFSATFLRPVLACWYTASSDAPNRPVPDACIDPVAVSDGSLWPCGPQKLGWDFELAPGPWQPAFLGVGNAMCEQSTRSQQWSMTASPSRTDAHAWMGLDGL